MVELKQGVNYRLRRGPRGLEATELKRVGAGKLVDVSGDFPQLLDEEPGSESLLNPDEVGKENVYAVRTATGLHAFAVKPLPTLLMAERMDDGQVVQGPVEQTGDTVVDPESGNVYKITGSFTPLGEQLRSAILSDGRVSEGYVRERRKVLLGKSGDQIGLLHAEPVEVGDDPGQSAQWKKALYGMVKNLDLKVRVEVGGENRRGKDYTDFVAFSPMGKDDGAGDPVQVQVTVNCLTEEEARAIIRVARRLNTNVLQAQSPEQMDVNIAQMEGAQTKLMLRILSALGAKFDISEGYEKRQALEYYSRIMSSRNRRRG